MVSTENIEDAVYILANLEKEAQIKRQLEELEKMDPEEAYDDFEETMKKVKEIWKHDNGAFQDETSVRVRVLFEDIQRRKAIKALVFATEKVDKKLLQESCTDCDCQRTMGTMFVPRQSRLQRWH